MGTSTGTRSGGEETDNIWFTLLTQNTAPVHFDRHYAAQTDFGRPLVDSTFTVALVTGQSVIDVSQNVMANLGYDEVRLPAPVFGFNRTVIIHRRGYSPGMTRPEPEGGGT